MRSTRHAKTLLPVLAALLLLLANATAAKTRSELRSNEGSFDVYNDYLIVVQGSVGPLRGLKFLLDTGQTFSSIDRRIAEKLNLTKRQGAVFNIDKMSSVEWANVTDFAYGPQHVSDIRVMIEDLRYLRANASIDGVIGLDLLRRTNFRLDLIARRILFGTTEKRAARSVPMHADGICLKVELEFDGRPVWMIADTCMKGIVSYQDQLDSMAANYRVQRQITGISLGGPIRYTPALVARLRLGTQDLDRQVYLVPASTNPLLQHTAGYLGLATLNAKIIEFDFDHNELRWSK